MNYAKIRTMDIANGPGVRVSLYVQGCDFHCPGCFNSETWNPEGGKEFTEILEDFLVKSVSQPFIVGITILGGEPFHKKNRETILRLIERVSKECPGKNIWVYTGYLYEELLKQGISKESLSHIDILVDGPFIQALANPNLRFRGSSNQRLIDVKTSIRTGSVTHANL